MKNLFGTNSLYYKENPSHSKDQIAKIDKFTKSFISTKTNEE
jgi:hypothetical protein